MDKKDKELLKTVTDKLEFKFTKEMLVKPLPDEYVEKEITKPVITGKKDENNYDINDSKTEKEMVLTNFRKGIVLALPEGYEWPDKDNHPKVGDTVAYFRKHATDFDLFKDSQLVNPYNIVGFISK